MCGADQFGRRVFDVRCGSSPRVRGRRSRKNSRTRIFGLIPACAGQTVFASAFFCGDGGSSPRVRGRQVEIVMPYGVTGLIPACAGQTRRVAAANSSNGAHPRVCGADLRASAVAYMPSGLIPACAGQTSTRNRWTLTPGAHPRVCGADTTTRHPPWTSLGSSPRVRGRRRFIDTAPPVTGLIPACAGQTGNRTRSSRTRRAHPRVCGSDWRCRRYLPGAPGSSPRVRGRPVQLALRCFRPGLIPACAGQTTETVRPCPRRRAHPRVCGADSAFNASNRF